MAAMTNQTALTVSPRKKAITAHATAPSTRDDPEDDLVPGGDRRAIDDRYRRQILLGANVGDVAVGFLDAIRWCGGG